MSLFSSMGISASALTAERVRMELISENLANIYTTRTAEGTPYRRKVAAVVPQDQGFGRLLAGLLGNGGRRAPAGVRVLGVYHDPRPFQQAYMPGHPDADEDGFVLLPNVDVAEEMVNMIAAARAYEANVTAFNVSKSLIQSALTIGQ